MSLQPAIFLDKDGTLVRDVPYNVDTEKMQLEPGVVEGLRLFHQAGYRLIVVSNQSGVARGMFPESALAAVEKKLREMVWEAAGVKLDGFYYCPHHPQGSLPRYTIDCECRKPRPGLLLLAAKDLSIDLPSSWMVGDILNDVEAGHRAGCRTVLINNGNETEWAGGPHRRPEYTATSLADAAVFITTGQRQNAPGREVKEQR